MTLQTSFCTFIGFGLERLNFFACLCHYFFVISRFHAIHQVVEALFEHCSIMILNIFTITFQIYITFGWRCNCYIFWHCTLGVLWFWSPVTHGWLWNMRFLRFLRLDLWISLIIKWTHGRCLRISHFATIPAISILVSWDTRHLKSIFLFALTFGVLMHHTIINIFDAYV